MDAHPPEPHDGSGGSSGRGGGGNGTAGAPPPGVQQHPPPATPGGFGSFHSGDVEALVRLPAEAYAPPPRPFPLPPLDAGDLGARAFGAPFRHEFLIDLNAWTFLNAGAFGGALRAAAGDAERWRRHCEAQPLRFIDR